ncbi:MAG: hypothetical protein K1X64_19420 [Myxococcaceae bacterium]|nr:hypothetical protein [Myxococcaceae bacterium]
MSTRLWKPGLVVALTVLAGWSACDFDKALNEHCARFPEKCGGDAGQLTDAGTDAGRDAGIDAGSDAGCSLKMMGDTCTADSECCTNNCLNHACAVIGQCAGNGGLCKDSTDCCKGFGCKAGACEAADPGYFPSGFMCHFHAMCGGGFCTDGGLCTDATLPPRSCRGVGMYCSQSTFCCGEFTCFDEYPARCTVAADEPCVLGESCYSGNCENGKCSATKRPDGTACTEHLSCLSGNCQDGGCAACLPINAPCVDHLTCCSQNCDTSLGKCAP